MKTRSLRMLARDMDKWATFENNGHEVTVYKFKNKDRFISAFVDNPDDPERPLEVGLIGYSNVRPEPEVPDWALELQDKHPNLNLKVLQDFLWWEYPDFKTSGLALKMYQLLEDHGYTLVVDKDDFYPVNPVTGDLKKIVELADANRQRLQKDAKSDKDSELSDIKRLSGLL